MMESLGSQYRNFDNHFHLRQTLERDPHCFAGLDQKAWSGVSSCHDKADWDCVMSTRERLPEIDLRASFGIHPQWPVTDYQDLLFELAHTKKIEAIGECGFDFFDGRPHDLEVLQKRLFSLQLDLALECDLPVIIHLRRATDMVFVFKKELKKLPLVVFHSWPGPLNEALSILAHGINARFSFGTTLLWGAKKAVDCLKHLPLEHIGLETDAPYQAPRDLNFTSLSTILRVFDRASELRAELPSILD